MTTTGGQTTPERPTFNLLPTSGVQTRSNVQIPTLPLKSLKRDSVKATPRKKKGAKESLVPSRSVAVMVPSADVPKKKKKRRVSRPSMEFANISSVEQIDDSLIKKFKNAIRKEDHKRGDKQLTTVYRMPHTQS